MWRYFLCHRKLHCVHKYPIADFQKTVLPTEHWRETCNSVSCIHTSKCNFSEAFFPGLIWGYFLFHDSSQWAPKYHFAEHKITELANSSKKGRVELCVMKSHTRKQYLSKLLSSYRVRIFPFSPWAPKGSQISLCRFREKSVSKLLPEKSAVTLWEEVTDHKEVSQKYSVTFWTDDISFISVGLHAIQISPSQVPQKQW